MLATRASWLGDAEVTEVWYDPGVLAFADLLRHGVSKDCAHNVWTTTAAQAAAATALVGERSRSLAGEPRPDKEPKYYLLQSKLKFVPMTAAQAARCNAALAPGSTTKPEKWLSPRQLDELRRIEREPQAAWRIAIDVPLLEAWRHLPKR